VKSATISPCGTYRYTLHRNIPCVLRWIRPCLFVMLNPSIADASIDDPTIRRCIGFARSWQCTSLTVVNLFALRATDPAELAKHPDPHGPENPQHIEAQLHEHRVGGVIVVAWGAHAMAAQTPATMPFRAMAGVQCLGKTKSGAPRHPLYVPASAELVPWP